MQGDEGGNLVCAEMVQHGGQAVIWQTPDGSMSGVEALDEQLPVVGRAVGCAGNVGQVLLKLRLWDELCVDVWREGNKSDEE